MARINRISITLCALLFTTLPLTPMAHASKQARESSATTHITKKQIKRKARQPPKRPRKPARKQRKKPPVKVRPKAKPLLPLKNLPLPLLKTPKTRSKHAVNKTASASFTEKCTKRKGYKSHCVKVKNAASGTLADAHKAKVQKATKVAMNKLMQQIGKPYRWGGSSPRTGFDCSGLVYYAYKDLVKIRIPRTANEMYHLRDAAPIERSELKNGDLVFFRTQGRGTADHVGVYVGNGKFIQSPRTGQEIQITSLSEDYWQRHYVGARRVMTPKTLR
ncbi:putative exported hydrolase [Escherichia coli]|uniref:Putative exported hydrolase n=1 Tax=Escherichia coli TaxID=562 RepID=A0A376S9L8_ECOLX|nr:putative exported hydrolase [Escherichia coli]